MIWIIVAAVVVVVLIGIFVTRARRRADGVDSFRRQIDALSPEARRPVVDQVQSVAGSDEAPDDDNDDDPAERDDATDDETDT